MLTRVLKSKTFAGMGLVAGIVLLVLALSLLGTDTKLNLLVVLCAMLGLAPVTIFHLYQRDIRTRNLGENALRESERRYRLLTEYSPNAIGVHEGGRLVYTNPAWVKLLGAHSVQEIAGTQFLEFFHPDSQAEMKRLFASLHRADDEIQDRKSTRLNSSD